MSHPGSGSGSGSGSGPSWIDKLKQKARSGSTSVSSSSSSSSHSRSSPSSSPSSSSRSSISSSSSASSSRASASSSSASASASTPTPLALVIDDDVELVNNFCEEYNSAVSWKLTHRQNVTNRLQPRIIKLFTLLGLSVHVATNKAIGLCDEYFKAIRLARTHRENIMLGLKPMLLSTIRQLREEFKQALKHGQTPPTSTPQSPQPQSTDDPIDEKHAPDASPINISQWMERGDEKKGESEDEEDVDDHLSSDSDIEDAIEGIANGEGIEGQQHIPADLADTSVAEMHMEMKKCDRALIRTVERLTRIEREKQHVVGSAHEEMSALERTTREKIEKLEREKKEWMDKARLATEKVEEEKRKISEERQRLETLRKAFETASVELSAERLRLDNEVRARQQAQERVQQEAQEAKMCVVCLDKEKGILFEPCGHICTCPSCSEVSSRCPLCQIDITSRRRVYPFS